MIGLIVLGLAFLFFLVVAFFAAKTWHVGHIVAMSFLFLFTLLLLFMTATMMRTHNKFRPAYQQALKDIETQEQRTRTLNYGDPSAPAGAGSLVGERTLAKVELATRGRVWRNVRGRITAPGGPIQLDMRFWNNDGCLRVGQVEGDSTEDEIAPVPDEVASGTEGGEAAVADPGVVDPAVADPGIADPAVADPAVDPAVAGANPHGIAQGQFVYAFKEFPISLMTEAEKEYYFGALGTGEDAFPEKDKDSKSCRVPVAFLGKFVVQESSPQMLLVVPTGGLTPGQVQQLVNPATWVLYEQLPMDSHDVFSGADPARLPSLIPLNRLVSTGVQIPPAVHHAMVSEFAADGKELEGRPANPFRVRQQVKFLQDYTVDVDLVVAEGSELPPTDKPFDGLGRAQTKSLMQNEPTKFAKDDIATFDGITAERLVRDEIAQFEGKPTYSRQLRDFQFMLDAHQARLLQVAEQRNAVQAEVDALTASLQRLQEQVDKHRLELSQLEQDKQGFDTEREQLREFRRLLEARRKLLEGEVDTLL